MLLSAGTRLGPYEIVAPLGAGGMGEVYRARDTRLDRSVAIKVVLELGGADANRRARFEREARIVASLDHPHICTLHDVGRERPVPPRPDPTPAGGPAGTVDPAIEIDFLVMPLLSGETLAARLTKGALPIADAIEIAQQVARALDRAHRHGIVHRDLKPGNVMLTKTGAVLLDFGLARIEPASSEDAANVDTQSALTMTGAVLGTVPYMAPEQLSGQQADARSDVWAFGCVLYEMVGGRRPFGGDNRSALIGAIMASDPPPLSQVRPGVPRAIAQLVSGALVKDREERWQSMRDVTRALAIAAVEQADSASETPRSRRPQFIAIGVLGAVAIALAAAWAMWGRAPDPALVRFDVDVAGSGQIARVTDTDPYFAASPDGSRIAFVATVANKQDIWIKRIDGEKPERLADTTGGSAPFWSPDGQSIAFVAGGHLKRKALGAGPAQVLCDANQAQGTNGTWSREGVVLFAEWGTGRLSRVSENGGAPVVVRQHVQPAIGFPQFLPDGRHYLYIMPDISNATVHAFVGSLESTADADVSIAGVASRMEFAAGRLFFWREGSLLAQPFDLKTFQLTGEAVSLVDRIHGFGVTGFAAFSVSPRLLVYQAGAAASQLVWADRQGLEHERVGPVADFGSVRLSPDESSIAFTARDPRLGTNDIFIQEVRRPVTRPFTSDRGTENGPVWSPDGQTIVYTADRHAAPNLQARAADGTGTERELLPPSPGGPQITSSFTPDGRLLFAQPNPGTDYDIMMIPVDHHADPVVVVQTKGRDTSARVSSDGRWLAFQSNVSGRLEIYVQPFDDAHARRQVSQDGGADPKWRHDGKELFYLAGPDRRQLMAVDMIASGTAIEPGAPRLLFERYVRVPDYDVTRDGNRFLLITPDPIAERGTLSAVVNWMKLIRP